MPPRETLTRYTVGDHLESIRSAVREAKYRADELALLEISPWELYRATGFVTNINRICVDGVTNFALKAVNSIYPVREMASKLMGFGLILFKESADEVTGDPFFEIENPDHIFHVGWKRRLGQPDEVVEVIIRYLFQRPATGQQTVPAGLVLTPSSEPAMEDWVYYARYYYTDMENADGDMASTPVIDERIFPLSKEADEIAKGPQPEPLSYWPYRGVRWETGKSILEPIKASILRVEAAWRNIMQENDVHSSRALVLENVDEVITGKREANEQGFLQTPAGSKAYYPDMHSEGMNPMFREYEMAMEEIREAVGALRVKELHNASGPSRTFELFPNVALANVLRDKVEEMVHVLDPNATVDMGPLIDYTPQEIAIIKPVYDEMQLNGSMTADEYIKKIRMLTGLPEMAGLKLRGMVLVDGKLRYLPEPEQTKLIEGSKGGGAQA